ncbi:exodeoxyribonuclease VII large subunit, partial [Xanthomonas sp. LMG 12459]
MNPMTRLIRLSLALTLLAGTAVPAAFA